MSTKNPKIRFDKDEHESDFEYNAQLTGHIIREKLEAKKDQRGERKNSSERYHRAGVPNGTMFSITPAVKMAREKALKESDSTLSISTLSSGSTSSLV